MDIYVVTTCAACAAPLTQKSPHCKRCKSRYCNLKCQQEHKRGGHKHACKLIKRVGGAEQDNADKKYAEAVAAAVEACAEDTQGQTCYICLEDGNLVRGCVCHGTEGFVHVSCLAKHAQILVTDAEERNMNDSTQWKRWHTCSLCEHLHHGVVRCALGWACWRTYASSTGPWHRANKISALRILGGSLAVSGFEEESLALQKAELAFLELNSRGVPADENKKDILALRHNIAITYRRLGRHEEALCVRREDFAQTVALCGSSSRDTFAAVISMANSLVEAEQFDEAKHLLLENITAAQSTIGDNDKVTLGLRNVYGTVLYRMGSADEAVAVLTYVSERARLLFGEGHPLTNIAVHNLNMVRDRRSDNTEQAALAALAFVAAVAFLVGRRYLRK